MSDGRKVLTTIFGEAIADVRADPSIVATNDAAEFAITLTHARGRNFDVRSVRSEPPTCIDSVATPVRSSDSVARLTIVPRADASSRVFRIIVEVSCDGVLSEIPVTVYSVPRRGAD
jgi:hypothetical protein